MPCEGLAVVVANLANLANLAFRCALIPPLGGLCLGGGDIPVALYVANVKDHRVVTRAC